ncbi:hypothetical protein C8R47DRAFT_1091299 [Mycena vitilis]|nr:hypothetical protein C8R47DRAFT_1091299 [Mycena vitilis]
MNFLQTLTATKDQDTPIRRNTDGSGDRRAERTRPSMSRGREPESAVTTDRHSRRSTSQAAHRYPLVVQTESSEQQAQMTWDRAPPRPQSQASHHSPKAPLQRPHAPLPRPGSQASSQFPASTNPMSRELSSGQPVWQPQTMEVYLPPPVELDIDHEALPIVKKTLPIVQSSLTWEPVPSTDRTHKLSTRRPEPFAEQPAVLPRGWSNMVMGSNEKIKLTKRQQRMYFDILGNVDGVLSADIMKSIPLRIPAQVIDGRLPTLAWTMYHPVTEQIPEMLPPLDHDVLERRGGWAADPWPAWAAALFVATGDYYMSRSRGGILIQHGAMLAGRIVLIAHHEDDQRKILFTMSTEPPTYYVLIDSARIFQFQPPVTKLNKPYYYRTVNEFLANQDMDQKIEIPIYRDPINDAGREQRALSMAYTLCGGSLPEIQLAMTKVEWWAYLKRHHHLNVLLQPQLFKSSIKEEEKEMVRVKEIEEKNGRTVY